MKSIAVQLEEIRINSQIEKANFDQLTRFENTIKSLEKVLTLDKPTYNLPQVDTIGKLTFSSLNKK